MKLAEWRVEAFSKEEAEVPSPSTATLGSQQEGGGWEYRDITCFQWFMEKQSDTKQHSSPMNQIFFLE